MEDKKIDELMRLCLVQGSSLKMKDLERITELSLELISAYRAVELDRNNWRKQALEEDASHSEFVDFIRKHNDESSHAEYVKFREGPAFKWLRQLKEIKIPDELDHRDEFIRYLISEQSNEKGTTMDADVYQKKAHSFAMYKDELYPVLGLSEEVGEFTGRIAKHLRKCGREGWNSPDTELAKQLKGELSDICWFVAELATVYGWSLCEVFAYNISKLEERKKVGVICGSGETVEERIKNANGSV